MHLKWRRVNCKYWIVSFIDSECMIFHILHIDPEIVPLVVFAFEWSACAWYWVAGLFQNYCVHPGDKLLFIYSNAAKSNICNSNIQCDSNTAENKHLISLFVGIFVSLFRCMFEVLYLCMQCASSFSPSLFSAHTFQTTQEWDKRIKSGLGLRNGEYTHTHSERMEIQQWGGDNARVQNKPIPCKVFLGLTALRSCHAQDNIFSNSLSLSFFLSFPPHLPNKRKIRSCHPKCFPITLPLACLLSLCQMVFSSKLHFTLLLCLTLSAFYCFHG